MRTTSSVFAALFMIVALPVAGTVTISTPAYAASAKNCVNGYVWRDAINGDAACVTPQERSDAKRQNANAANNVDVNGNYGPNSCRQGYVWREAFGGDVVCVTPYERSEAARMNAEAPSHTLR